MKFNLRGLSKFNSTFLKGIINIFIYFLVISAVAVLFLGVTLEGYIPDYFGVVSNQDNSVSTSNRRGGWEKPVIYLYPQTVQNIKILLEYDGNFTATYPAYNNGWDVLAYPDGKLINKGDNKEYSYLFWEGIPDKEIDYDWSKGFVVRGEDTAEFLRDTLSKIGLTPKEYNEFIVYWMPRMQNNKYNLIHFASKEEYDDHAVLDISPKPDSVLRVFMVYKPLTEWQKVGQQEINPFECKGFTVVEWGGTEAE